MPRPAEVAVLTGLGLGKRENEIVGSTYPLSNMAILQMLSEPNRATVISTVLAIAICIAYFRSRRPAENEPPLLPPKNGIPFIGHLVGLLSYGFKYYSMVV